MESHVYHIPVMLFPSVDGLNIKQSGTYVDVTLGGGGHSREILRRLGPQGRLFSFDQDQDALKQVQSDSERSGITFCDGRTAASEGTTAPQWTLVQSNFRYLKNWMRYYDIDHIDGLLADLGVSSHHFDEASRGFSFRNDAPLDMRMNQRSGQSAADVVNSYSAEQLTSLFRVFGELRQAHRLAELIVKARKQHDIQTTGELVSLLSPALAPAAQKKDLARIFQALRIEVNHEMDALREMLEAATELLAPGGRLVVLSYHSLEDRMVKNLMRSGNIQGDIHQNIYGHIDSTLKPVGKAQNATPEEQEANPRSRSVTMRVAEKTEES
ncbi:MAG: 16S rRNA (cytosine(1402)-N(4))-methyltransferase RsmH [Bacteroidaceae bacterium]|nr:16S rRNA (cytosine(1402)-N(4))-methyltransferase RsmH [Bacteroidaceae bacterium]